MHADKNTIISTLDRAKLKTTRLITSSTLQINDLRDGAIIDIASFHNRLDNNNKSINGGKS